MYGEQIVSVVVPLIVIGILHRWYWSGDLKPDPWEQVADREETAEDDQPVCQRCLDLTKPGLLFCPNCGATVDSLTGMMPWINALALGDVMREGVTMRERRLPATQIGLFLMLIAASMIVPFGLFLFLPAYMYFYFSHGREVAL